MARRKPRRPKAPTLPSILAIDLRGLACLRFGLGLLVVIDLISRLRSFGAHYSEEGVLPSAVYFAEFEKKWHISLHLLSSSDAVNIVLFIIAIAFALMFALGYRTRLSNIVTWVLLISLHSRNPFVLQGGDEILRAFVFWGMFLPLGARFSIDRALSSDHNDPPIKPYVSMATLCLFGQLVLLYAFATASKMSHPVWWRDGLGVYFALGVEQFTTSFGHFLRETHGLLRPLNFATLILQAAAPILLFSTIARDRIRTVLPVVMIALHLGFAVAMELGLFSYIVVVVWLAFLAPGPLKKIEKRLPDLGPSIRAKADKLFAKREPRPAAPVRPIKNPIYKAALGSLLVYLLWWNLAGVDRDIFRIPEPLRPIAQVLRLEQRWKMFSNPPRWSQWFVVTGVSGEGPEIDLQTNKPPSWERPDLVSATFPTQRWRKYMNNIAAKRGSAQRKHFAAFACQRWNHAHPKAPLSNVRITMLRQATPHKPGLRRQPPDRVVLGTWSCEDGARKRSAMAEEATIR